MIRTIRPICVALLILLVALRVSWGQVIERPTPFDSSSVLMAITPDIANRANLRPPTWPVSGDFSEARLYAVTDSTYILTVSRKNGVVERYSLTLPEREAIRVALSRVPREALERRNDARNAFIRNQTLLGVLLYGPTFAGAISDNTASATAGYLVVAGGSFFAASEISRRNFISRAQNDLSTHTALGGAGTGWAISYLAHASDRAQAASAFVGGLAGTAVGLRWGRNMSEAEAVGAGFGATNGALIAWGTIAAIDGEERCESQPNGVFECTSRISDRAAVATILASGLIGYPLGVLYPRNARYNVTPGDIQMLYATAGIGALAGASFLKESPKASTAFAATTAGWVLGIIAGDRFLVRRFDHSRTDASRITLGTGAGGVMGAGIAALIDNDFRNPQLVFASTTVGAIAGLIVSEKYFGSDPDAGRRSARLSFDPMSIFLTATRTPGNHSVINVRF